MYVYLQGIVHVFLFSIMMKKEPNYCWELGHLTEHLLVYIGQSKYQRRQMK